MTNSERAFLALSETLNFTRAADKIFITQQGISEHIKKLEEDYGTTLVIRKPKVQLTPAGEVLRDMLLRQEAMDRDVRQTISEINSGDAGEVSIGISVSRVRAFAADIIIRYHIAHPHVKIHLYSDITMKLESMLLDNKLDGIIAVNAVPHRNLQKELLFQDPVYLAVPDHIARERTGDATTVDIADYADLPFIRDLSGSTTSFLIDPFLESRNIELNNIINVSEYAVQASLCKRFDAAMFCAKSFAYYKEGSIVQAGLRTLELEGLGHTVDISLMTSRNRHYARCATDFFQTIRDSLDTFYEKVM